MLSFSIRILFTLRACCCSPLQKKKKKKRDSKKEKKKRKQTVLWTPAKQWDAASSITYPKSYLSLLLPVCCRQGSHTQTATGSASQPEPSLHPPLQEEKSRGTGEGCSPLWVSSNEAVWEPLRWPLAHWGWAMLLQRSLFNYETEDKDQHLGRWAEGEKAECEPYFVPWNMLCVWINETPCHVLFGCTGAWHKDCSPVSPVPTCSLGHRLDKRECSKK